MKTINLKNKKIASNIIIVFLFLALPILVWSLVNLNFNYKKKAASGEPTSCFAVDKIVYVTPTNSEGNDPNDTGCHNIQYAIDAAVGDGYTVSIAEGVYFVPSQITIQNKSNITIKGDETRGSGAVVLNFSPGSGFNFLIHNSSGAIQWMTIQGGSSNGMLSIQSSNDFEVAYLSAYSQTSHTLDIQNSNNIRVYNTELQSSAGALEVSGSQNINIANNRIHNSNNGISIFNSSAIISSNTIYNNREAGVVINKPIGIQLNSNTVADNLGAGLSIMFIDQSYETIINVYKNIFANNKYGVLADSTMSLVDTFTFSFNDVWSNTTNNYSGISNRTGSNGNISGNPLFGTDYCVYTGSPVLYGLISNGEYMGNRLYCNDAFVPNDDVYFKDAGNSFTLTTTNKNPNVSINPEELIAGETYVLNVTYALQNNLKSQTASTSGIPVVVLVNNQFKSGNDIPYSLIAAHNDGASDTQSMSFTASGNETQIEIQFDPNNIFKETNEANNSYTYSFPINPSPSPISTSKVGDVNNDNKVNIIDIGIVVDEYDSTSPNNPRADVNNSGKVDLIDIGIIVDKYEW